MPQPLEYLRPIFIEHQRFRQRWLWVVITLAGLLILSIQLLLQRTLRGYPSSLAMILAAAPVGFMVWFYLAITLTVRVDANGVHVRFFPLHKLTIPFRRIVASNACDYDPHGEFGGWGMKGPPGRWGWCFTVSGRRGVRLDLENGHRLLIGSQRAEELAAAIKEAQAT